ncbi:hypothetical protein ACJ3XI_11300 [Litorimonas sp. RW-G-Af-16]|uniref:RipA family octameric membrane protein n=1 Tax=Litorimonas sp. RW-G-Af-16 TaxID=3241168 RepID=UPI00390C856D
MNSKTTDKAAKHEMSNASAEHYSYIDYEHDFKSDSKIRKAAFEMAHNIREFEINLYWKRAAYFWTFISATLAGHALIETRTFDSQGILALLLACT